MNNSRGKFITFEGGEACGKTTQIDFLKIWLENKGIKVVQARDPGSTLLGEAIRILLKHDETGRGMCARSELFLFEASRAQLVEEIIKPALEAGKWVLCDRFYDSTTVYQGIARGLDMEEVTRLNSFATDRIKPNLTLVLELDAKESHRRIQGRKPNQGEEFDRMESEPDDFFKKVREGFQKLAKEEPRRIKVIRADGTREEVFEQIQKEVKDAFHECMD